jgi:uncharacterized membrane protein
MNARLEVNTMRTLLYVSLSVLLVASCGAPAKQRDSPVEVADALTYPQFCIDLPANCGPVCRANPENCFSCGFPDHCTITHTQPEGFDRYLIEQPYTKRPYDPAYVPPAVCEQASCTDMTPTMAYDQIPLVPGDTISIRAGGCVNTGGVGDTRKRYIDPIGPFPFAGAYRGYIHIPGLVGEPGSPNASIPGMPFDRLFEPRRLNDPAPLGNVATQIFMTATTPTTLHLGYHDDEYPDNGYQHPGDEGTGHQCFGAGDAWVELTIHHGGPFSGPFPTPVLPKAWDLTPNQIPGDPFRFDDNFLFLEPRWAWQGPNTKNIDDAPLFDAHSRIVATETSQQTYVDNSSWVCQTNFSCNYDSSLFPGGSNEPAHVNWVEATYEGQVFWDSHEGEDNIEHVFVHDDDYNLKILSARPVPGTNPAYSPGITSTNSGTPAQTFPGAGFFPGEPSRMIKAEFDAGETVDLDGFDRIPWWKRFHDLVDTESVDEGHKGVVMMDGRDAIVIGLMGLDTCHKPAWAELHPLHGFAIRESVIPEVHNDKWAMMARNYGNEGMCSTNNWELNGLGGAMKFRIHRPCGAGQGMPAFGPETTFRQGIGPGGGWRPVQLPTDAVTDALAENDDVIILVPLIDGSKGRMYVVGELQLDWPEGDPSNCPVPAPPPSAGPPLPPSPPDEGDAIAAVYSSLTVAQQAVALQMQTTLMPKRRASPPSTLLNIQTMASFPRPPRAVPTATPFTDVRKEGDEIAKLGPLCALTNQSMPDIDSFCRAAGFSSSWASFEDPSRPWTADAGGLSTNTTDKTQGSASLEIDACGSVFLVGPIFNTREFPIVGSDMSFDVFVPFGRDTASVGSTVITADIPSAGLNNVTVGAPSLNGLPLGQWSTLTFPVPASVFSAFQGGYSCARITIGLAISSCDAPNLLIDNLRWSGTVQRTGSVPVYTQDWEFSTGGWSSRPADGELPPAIDIDPTSPWGSKVQRVDRDRTGGDFRSPAISVTPSVTYCVSSSVRTVGGNQPYLGVELYDSGEHPAGVAWLMGPLGLTDPSGPTTHIRTDTDSWVSYSRSFTPPPGITTLRIINQYSGGSGNGGPAVVYFDDVAVWQGGCPTISATDMTVAPNMPGAAVVNYAVTVTDPLATVPLPLACDPPAGSKFFAQTTTRVNCHAERATGVGANASFDVRVLADPSDFIVPEDIGSAEGYSQAHGINNAGLTVGWDTSDASPYPGGIRSTAFAFDGVRRPLATPGVAAFAMAVNDSGDIVGRGGHGPDPIDWNFPFRILSDGTFEFLQGSGNYGGTADDINAAGQIAGTGYFPDFPSGVQMFRTTADGTMHVLGALSGPGFQNSSEGRGIGEDGTVVGLSYGTNFIGLVATMYRDSDGIHNLNDFLPAGSQWQLFEAKAVSGTSVVGWGDHGGKGRAFRLDTGTRQIVDLGGVATLLDGRSTNLPEAKVVAHDINAAGHIVGAVYDQWPFWPQVAFYYTDQRKMVDLNSCIDPASGWFLRSALSINDHDVVVGFGEHDGQRHAFRMKACRSE